MDPAVVEVVALPLRDAVIVPALKLPEASRATTVEAVFADVASTAHVVAAEPLKLLPVRYVPRVNVFVVLAVTVMLADPLKETPLMVRAVVNSSAVPAVATFRLATRVVLVITIGAVPVASVFVN